MNYYQAIEKMSAFGLKYKIKDADESEFLERVKQYLALKLK